VQPCELVGELFPEGLLGWTCPQDRQHQQIPRREHNLGRGKRTAFPQNVESFRLGREQVVRRHVDERLNKQRGPAAPGGDARERRHPALDRLDCRDIGQSRAVQAVKQYRSDRHENAGYLAPVTGAASRSSIICRGTVTSSNHRPPKGRRTGMIWSLE
jgi:hypothetical protein